MTTNTKVEERRVQRDAVLQWVPVSLMTVSTLAQRELNQARVDRIVAHFDPEQLGAPTVNKRHGQYFIIDGQHRVEAVRAIGWENQQLQCWVYEGLSEAEEAEKFLKLNDVLAVDVFSKFRVGVQAKRQNEMVVQHIVQKVGLNISRAKEEGCIMAVGTLMRIYERAGGKVLERTLYLIRETYGTPGLTAPVMDGLALVCARYGSELDDEDVMTKLSGIRAGVNGLLGRAEVLRKTTRQPKAHCVAASIVEILNVGRRGRARLASWFSEGE